MRKRSWVITYTDFRFRDPLLPFANMADVENEQRREEEERQEVEPAVDEVRLSPALLPWWFKAIKTVTAPSAALLLLFRVVVHINGLTIYPEG